MKEEMYVPSKAEMEKAVEGRLTPEQEAQLKIKNLEDEIKKLQKFTFDEDTREYAGIGMLVHNSHRAEAQDKIAILKAEVFKISLNQKATDSYNCDSFEKSNSIMAEIVRDELGEEAANSLYLLDPQRKKLKTIFYDAALTVANGFRTSFDENGNYLSEKESDFWVACDKEGPVAKQYLREALEITEIGDKSPEHTSDVLNNVFVEDAIELVVKTLKSNKMLDENYSQQVERELLELCKDSKKAKELFSKAVPTDDYYYSRINREEKINDESILKFNNGEAHNSDDQKIIDLSLRLANATWLAAQRHSAKKDGKTDRINPSKRGGVFNTPDHRHIQQYREAIASRLSPSAAITRVVFELCKDSWMLED